MNWDAYFKFDAISEFLEHITTTHSEICSLQTIGKTVEGRDIKLIKISSGEDKKKPAIFIEGGFLCKFFIAHLNKTTIII
jgi:carboxypeptidase A4